MKIVCKDCFKKYNDFYELEKSVSSRNLVCPKCKKLIQQDRKKLDATLPWYLKFYGE